MIEVLCIGQLAWDISAGLPEFPVENTKSEVRDLLECSGGPAANAACLLAKWGARCAFAGLVGTDDEGGRAIRGLQRFGVDTSLMAARADIVTPVSIILINERTGSRTIINLKTEAGPLALASTDSWASAQRVLLFDGHEPDASLEAMRRFSNARTILVTGSLREGTKLLA